MDACTRTAGPADAGKLGEIIEALDEGAVLCLHPGTYPLNAVVSRSLTIRGLGQPGDVILDGSGRASVLAIGGDKPRVTVERLTITGGASREGGGGIRQSGFGELLVREVIFTENRADGAGGGALLVAKGLATLERCRVVDNRGGSGGALSADYVGRLVVRETLVAGNRGTSSAIYVHEGAELTLEHATVAGNHADAAIELFASTVQKPQVVIADSIVSGKVAINNGPRLPGVVKVARSLVDGEETGVSDGGGNQRAAAGFVPGDDPLAAFRPARNSPAAGIARPGSGLDLAGSPSGTTAGALQPTEH